MRSRRLRKALFIALLLASCGRSSRVDERPRLERVSAWIVGWDLPAGLTEWRAYPDVFDEIHLFAADFNSDDRLQFDARWQAPLRELTRWAQAEPGRKLWITVVNDRTDQEGEAIAKDPLLVHRLLRDDSARQNHLGDLMKLAADHPIDGVELDYERIDFDDWPLYRTFLQELEKRLSERGVETRVVLTPTQRYLEAPPPLPARLSIMTYNLHGPHSGPGPKTTPELISKIGHWLQPRGRLPLSRLVLATGGFEWNHAGRVLSLRVQDALELAGQHGASIQRTDFSTAHFTYSTGTGASQVWFEDQESLTLQWRTGSRLGYRELAIWRLGGNPPELFEWLRREKRD